jgi:hypothetical protein
MATQAKILIPHRQQLCINRAMRRVANGATFAQGRMFKNKWPCLFSMALGAGFVQARHGQSSRGLHNVQAVGIVALDTIHLPFKHRVVLRKMKLGIDVQMTLKTRCWILPGVND